MKPITAALLYILAADGRTALRDLADAVNVERSAARRHLEILRLDGLARREIPSGVGTPGGAPAFYTATASGMQLAAAEQVAA